MDTVAKKRTIFVGLSGGVDSAVAALLLQKQGHSVVGVFIRTWHPEGFPCSEGEDEREAMRVAAHLDIPFRTLDLRERYKKQVADIMIASYARGETPNPDVLCNREVKFGGFVEYAKQEGADAIATGHYARLVKTATGVSLLRGVDAQKDQSYFLALVPTAELRFAEFPIGSMKKDEVRALAKRHNLPNATRKDSQGICFLGAVDMQRFLSSYISLKPGVVLSTDGKSIGIHNGAPLYTLGERHGFSVSAQQPDSGPLYVIATDITSNTITVGEKDELKWSKTIVLRECIVQEESSCKNLKVQIRYHGKEYPAEFATLSPTEARVVCKEPCMVAKGQIAALYDNERLIGAGVVDALL